MKFLILRHFQRFQQKPIANYCLVSLSTFIFFSYQFCAAIFQKWLNRFKWNFQILLIMFWTLLKIVLTDDIISVFWDIDVLLNFWWSVFTWVFLLTIYYWLQTFGDDRQKIVILYECIQIFPIANSAKLVRAWKIRLKSVVVLHDFFLVYLFSRKIL